MEVGGMNIKYVLFATKNDRIFYISNTEPFIWSSEISQAKLYDSRYSAEYDILRKYENYISITKQLESHSIDNVYVSKVINMIETERYKLL